MIFASHRSRSTTGEVNPVTKVFDHVYSPLNFTTGFPAKWRLRNEHRNSMLMTCHYPDLSSASDWSCRVGNLLPPIRSTTQIWVVTRHRNGISALVSQMSFRGETSSSVAKCQLFSQAMCYRTIEELKNRTTGKNYNIWHAITWNNCEESPHVRCSERLQNGTYQCCL